MNKLYWKIIPNEPKKKGGWYLKNKTNLRFVAALALLAFLFVLCNFKEISGYEWVPYGLFLILALLAEFLYIRLKTARVLLLRFVFPLLLAGAIILLGAVGFTMSDNNGLLRNFPPVNDFFKAADLVTLGSSDFTEIKIPNHFLYVARFLGALLTTSAFLIAFGLAVGKENIDRFYFWMYRFLIRVRLKKGYYVVIGDDEKALYLAKNLEDHDYRFVFLDASQDDRLKESMKYMSCWYLKDIPWDRESLEKLYLNDALKVFILCAEDTTTFRTLQEMDEVTPKKSNQHWFIHFDDSSLRESIHKFLPRRSHQLNTFGVESLAAIRVLKKYPLYRKYEREFKNFHVAIVGFSRQAQELLFEISQIGHFKKDQYLRIQLYYLEEEKKSVDDFLSKYPIFNRRNKAFTPLEKSVINYTFQTISYEFIPLPPSEIEIRQHDFSLYKFLGPDSSNNLYVCVDKGMNNAKFLEGFLPTLSYLKSQNQFDIQVFTYYNYPDKDEQAYFEMSLNTLAPHIPVFCFGNMLDECSLESIKNEEDLALPQRIALIYHILYEDFQVEDQNIRSRLIAIKEDLNKIRATYTDQTISLTSYENNLENLLISFLKRVYDLDESYKRKIWDNIPEISRLSNIRAANHALIKNLLYDRITEEEKSRPWTKTQLKELAEIEHRRWNAEKLLTGWRPYINPVKWQKSKALLRHQKYHNFLIRYSDLPPIEKSKDWIQVMALVEQISPNKV